MSSCGLSTLLECGTELTGSSGPLSASSISTSADLSETMARCFVGVSGVLFRTPKEAFGFAGEFAGEDKLCKTSLDTVLRAPCLSFLDLLDFGRTFDFSVVIRLYGACAASLSRVAAIAPWSSRARTDAVGGVSSSACCICSRRGDGGGSESDSVSVVAFGGL